MRFAHGISRLLSILLLLFFGPALPAQQFPAAGQSPLRERFVPADWRPYSRETVGE
jgi:hypothetical protein